MAKVSIIVPTFNCSRYLPQALKSILEQSVGDYEVLIVDDGSTDDTTLVVDALKEGFGDRLRYIYQENAGLASARNTAIRYAGGEYIALLDADDLWLPRRLEMGLSVLENNERIGLVHADIIRFSTEGNTLDAPERDRRLLSGRIFKHIFLRTADISCPTVLFRKSCCDRVGLFDENLSRLGCEDRDLWLRIAKLYDVHFIDEKLACYRSHSGSMSRNKEKMLRARLYVVDKHAPRGGEDILLRYRALGKIYRDRGDEMLLSEQFADAKKEYFRALQYWPFNVWALLNMGKALFRMRVN